MNHPDTLGVLACSPIFHGLDAAKRQTIAGALSLVRWPRGAFVPAPGDGTDQFYALIEGRVKSTRQNRSGREVTLFLLGPGDGFSLVSLLDALPDTLAVQTIDAVTAAAAPVAMWHAWMDAYPEFRRAVYRYTHHRLRALGELASDLALHDTMTRLAHLLLRYCSDCLNGPECPLIGDLPHEELAHMIGTVRVVLNRLLSRLKRKGIVDTQGGRLRILDLERLLQIAERPPVIAPPD